MLDCSVFSKEKFKRTGVMKNNRFIKKQNLIPDAVGKRHRRKKLSFLRRASLTVEAAAAVPLFMLCMTALICMMEIYGIYAKETVHLQETAEQTGLAAAALSGGEAGSEYIDLIVPQHYTVRGIRVPGILIACRGRVYPWTGRGPAEDTSAYDDEGDVMVYMTDNGSVYHTSTQCSHLQLDIRSVSSSSVGRCRNADGSRYHACDKCVGNGGMASVVYIGKEGDCFHNSATCSGLTRHVRMEKMSEIGNISQCSRCAQEGPGHVHEESGHVRQ